MKHDAILKTRTYKTLMQRGDDPDESVENISAFLRDFNRILDEGGDYFDAMIEIEELFYEYIGLEPDYIEEFML
jgi:hypothetical protein